MSTRSRWSHIDLLTSNELRNSTVDGTTARYACGCMSTQDGVIWLCDYHAGFEDGAEAARNDMEKEEQ